MVLGYRYIELHQSCSNCITRSHNRSLFRIELLYDSVRKGESSLVIPIAGESYLLRGQSKRVCHKSRCERGGRTSVMYAGRVQSRNNPLVSSPRHPWGQLSVLTTISSSVSRLTRHSVVFGREQERGCMCVCVWERERLLQFSWYARSPNTLAAYVHVSGRWTHLAVVPLVCSGQ